MSKLELLRKITRQGKWIRFWERFLWVLLAIIWLGFIIWVLKEYLQKKKKKKTDLEWKLKLSKVFAYLLIFTAVVSLINWVVFSALWSVWNMGAVLVQL